MEITKIEKKEADIKKKINKFYHVNFKISKLNVFYNVNLRSISHQQLMREIHVNGDIYTDV